MTQDSLASWQGHHNVDCSACLDRYRPVLAKSGLNGQRLHQLSMQHNRLLAWGTLHRRLGSSCCVHLMACVTHTVPLQSPLTFTIS